MIRPKWLMTCFALGVASLVSAEMMPSFNMDMMCDRSARIVRGQLDQQGLLKVTRVLKGEPENPGTGVPLDAAMVAGVRKAIRVAEDTNLDGVVFLDEADRPIWSMAGIVVLEKTRVWMCQDDNFRGRGGFQHTENKDYTADSFVKKVRETLALIAQREVICQQAPSRERIDAILEFLTGKSQYQRLQLVRDLSSISTTEEDYFLNILKETDDLQKAGIILDLARELPFPAGSYDQIAVFLDRRHTPALRRKAISALPRIDMTRVATSFEPYLSLDEPLLTAFLLDIRGPFAGSVGQRPDANVIAPLARLTKEMKQRHAEQGRHVLSNESYALLSCIQSYAHPRFVPLVYDWALNSNHVTSNQALSTLQSLTGLSYERSQSDEWRMWMEKNRAVLQTDFDLQTGAGRMRWFAAWEAGDAAVKRLLMRLWIFERNPPEDILFQTAAGATGKNQKAAKHVLAMLWQHGCLSPECQKRIVVRFLHLKLVRHPSQFKDLRHLRIATHPEFPFPKDAWVQPQCAWSLNATPPRLGNSYGEFSLHDIEKVTVGSLSGGAKDDARVRALVEIRRVSRGAGRKVLWSHIWSFDAPAVSDVPFVEGER